MKPYIALCMFMVLGMVGFLLLTTKPLQVALLEWEEELSLPEDFDVIHTHVVTKRQKLTIIRVLEPEGYRHLLVLGEDRLTHWKLVDTIDLGIATETSLGHQIAKTSVTAAYRSAEEMPIQEECFHLAIAHTPYVIWYELQGEGIYTEHH